MPLPASLKYKALKEALNWNETSPRWARGNECVEQSTRLEEKLSFTSSIENSLTRIKNPSGKGFLPIWAFTAPQGGSWGWYIERGIKTHYVVKAEASEIARNCGFKDYYIDPFKDNAWGDQNLDGRIGTGPWSEFKTHYPNNPGF